MEVVPGPGEVARLSCLAQWARNLGCAQRNLCFTALVDRLDEIGATTDESLFFAVNLKELGHKATALQLIDEVRRIDSSHAAAHYEAAMINLLVSYQKGRQDIIDAVANRRDFVNAIRVGVRVAKLHNDAQFHNDLAAAADEHVFRTIEKADALYLPYLEWVGERIGFDANADRMFSIGAMPMCESLSCAQFLADPTNSNMIRFGDGEGAMFVSSAYEEMIFKDVLLPTRNHFAERWLGRPFQEISKLIYDRQSAIIENIGEFSLIGMPEPAWLLRSLCDENLVGFIGSIRAMMQINLVRSSLSENVRFFPTSVFHDLILHDAIGAALACRNSIAIVSWNTFHRLCPWMPGHCKEIIIPPSFSDVANLHIATQPMEVSDIVELGARLISATTSDDTILMCGGFFSKSFAADLVAKGRRVWDVGSALDLHLGFPVR